MSFKSSTIGRTIVSVVAVLLVVDGILQLISPPPMVEALIHVGYRFEGWELRRKTRSLKDPHGNSVPLTKSEYSLLVAFLDAPGRALSREQLLHATRTHEDIYDRSIDVQVLRLRRKLERDPSDPAVIRTERGVGYVFAARVERLF